MIEGTLSWVLWIALFILLLLGLYALLNGIGVM
jgi:hypothetical protein